jgi:hypothetical protein
MSAASKAYQQLVKHASMSCVLVLAAAFLMVIKLSALEAGLRLCLSFVKTNGFTNETCSQSNPRS